MNKELPAGSTLLNYRIVAKIGAGGMGEVYLAEDSRLHRQVVSPYNIAVIYAGPADSEKALSWLELAYEERSYYLPVYLTTDERLDHLRSEPRFKEMIRKIGLAE